VLGGGGGSNVTDHPLGRGASGSAIFSRGNGKVVSLVTGIADAGTWVPKGKSLSVPIPTVLTDLRDRS
jgi:hypothetical protein